jgi:signal peptidase I
MANEQHQAPNPYAPTDALNHGVAVGEPASAGVRRASRLGAVVVAIMAQPIAGAGFHLLNQPRRFVAWTAAGLLIRVLLIVSVWAALPKLCAIAVIAWAAAALVSVVDTAIAKPRSPPIKHSVLIGVLFVAAGIGSSLATRQWLVEAFQIPAGSMVPALLVGDHIFVKKGQSSVQRGDAIVFKFPMDPSTDYIKRVVAIGGDTIEVRDNVVSINGTALEHEPIDTACSYIDEASPIPDERGEPCRLVRETNAGRAYTIMLATTVTAYDYPRTVVPPGELFVMGDNRDNSYDSRKWGTVRKDLVKGKATVIWWSRVPNGAVRWSRIGRGIE